ncbi:putative lipoprotein [Fibrobacter succinogenes subsp. succinogenes S85]|uniref:Putative lipoprotein n=1 Tax=Fibrobacter succinogenes (strain ATCC 19169 / S85) TaxID=59374 RepID=C9RRM0_FIBSS|nr:FISUMP domain-containing protein [Fibrobacter succinogenes]ACX75206.1 hypothetical protein Fisuc_1611 [Fibrobacter succinogenes subsp. succinogenes S85]ADL27405.1 putative lipoprotein [Fibrobacter succinogenes subsp. succinogenes S85]
MIRNESRFFGGVFAFALAFAFVSMFSACSEKVAGGSSDDSGIYAVKDLDVAGVSQKGPFVKSSAVTVQGIDCKTVELTHEIFEGSVKSDKGDFGVDDVNLSVSCALFEVTGHYFNEVTGKKSAGEVTLHALSDLSDRKHVNINMLTELEYRRVMHLVSEEHMDFADAKKQAEKEVLAAFGIKGDFDNFEDLTIFEGGDGNAALLAVSVMMQAETDEAGLAKRIDKFADSFAETGKWKDDETKAAIESWQIDAAANGTLDSIRKNVESLGYADVVPAFEKFVEAFQYSSSVTPRSSSSSKVPEPAEESSSSSAKADAGSEYDASANTLKDLRDGQIYRTVKIAGQVWMAENLNYEVENSSCFKNSADSCAKYGRLYTLPIQGVCPSGWHLPSGVELNALVTEAGGPIVAGLHLKSRTDWYRTVRGTDALGFAALPAGRWSEDNGFVGGVAAFWSSSERDSIHVYAMHLSDYRADITFSDKDNVAYSVRCLKNNDSVESSSSGSEASSSSVKIALACKMKNTDYCKYETLIDERDGQTYKTIKIGTQTWMAENLNYASLQPTDRLDSTSFCYENEPFNCEKDGRLYLWSAVMDSAATWSDNGKGCGYGVVCSPTFPVRGVCPAGWHVPNRDEVMELLDAVGGVDVAGDMLISEYSGCIDEVDLYGFSFRPTGRKRSEGYYDDDGEYGYMWTTTDDY